MSIYKRSDSKNYWVRFEKDGHIINKSSGTTNKKIAEQIENRWKQELIEKIYLGAAESTTFKHALEIYLESKKKTPNLESVECFVRYMNKDHNTNVKLDSISTSDINRIRRHKERTGVSSTTVKHLINFLRGTINYAKDMGYLTQHIDYPKIKPHKHRLRFLSMEEEQRLLQELIPTHKSHIQTQQDNYDFVVFLLDVGCRYGEAAKIRWADVDLINKKINLHRTKVGNESILHLTDRLYGILKRRFNDKPSSTYVFTAQDGTPRKHSTIAIKKAMVRAGLNDVTVHDLRHTFASRLVQAGMSLHQVGEMLGHNDPSTTKKYGHLVLNDVSSQAVTLLNELNKQKGANLKVVQASASSDEKTARIS